MSVSILDNLGEEVTGIVSPVSICMLVTVALVRTLNPEGATSTSAVAIAQTFYKEKADDSFFTKLEGSVLNALFFVVFVAALTFVLFLLFKYGCEKIIYGYLAFSVFSIFFVLAGIMALQLVQLQPVPIDAISFLFVLWNFSVVGTVTMFLWPAPVLLRQGYMASTGVVMANLFTSIPAWTTWTLLIAMALYDLAAVLAPSGPLRLLVELAMERETEIPALVYEARPTGRQQRPEQPRHEGVMQQQPLRPASEGTELTDQSSRSSQSQEATPTAGAAMVAAPGLQHREATAGEAARPAAGRGSGPELQRPAQEAGLVRGSPVAGVEEDEGDEAEPLVQHIEAGRRAEDAEDPHDVSSHVPGANRDEFGMPDAVKLGIGDFVFYGVLVGRAAMYDLLTAFAAYLAVIAGLGATLILLALFRKALPALPISIALGICFYFLARTVLEPFLLPLSVHLLYF